MYQQKIISTFLFLFLFAMSYGKETNADHTVNAVIGDISYVLKFGMKPGSSANESTRIKTHLAYVENLLRQKNTSGLSNSQKTKRSHLLDLLQRYRVAGIFPRNFDFPGKRVPCFIDQEGRICAVGFLIEQTAGRAAAEQINQRHKYEYLPAMNDRVVDAWITASGLTKEECAMIQPTYDHMRGFDFGLQNKISLSTSAIHINIDTTGAENKYHLVDYNVSLFYLDLGIENKTGFSIRTDSSSRLHFRMIPSILKPGEKGLLRANLSMLLPQTNQAHRYKANVLFICSNDVNLNKTIEVICSFGKSKSIHIGQTIYHLPAVAEDMQGGGRSAGRPANPDNFRDIQIKRKLQIKNLTDSVLVIPRAAQAWSDTGPRLSYQMEYGSTLLPPKADGNIPVSMDMANKKNFDVYGNLIAHTRDYSQIDVVFTRFTYDPGGK